MIRSALKSMDEKWRDEAGMQKAIEGSIRDALRMHKYFGRPIVVWRDGQVVWIPPEEIVVPEEKNGHRAPSP